jgi:hypothetical protein
MQQKLKAAYDIKYPVKIAKPLSSIQFAAPDGYDDRMDHFINFFESVKNKKPVVEDAVFGFRAAAPCLACNDSYFKNKPVYWDPIGMKQVIIK